MAVPGDRKGTRDRLISAMVRTLGGAVARDKPAEYRVLAASDLDRTLVRTPGHWEITRADPLVRAYAGLVPRSSCVLR